MANWTLAPCLTVLLAEIRSVAPNSDRASDGTIGDTAHQATKSDHNPDKNGYVCAFDKDKDLRASFTMEDVVQYILSECRKPNTVGLDRGRLNYIIYNRRIWRADTGWKQEVYNPRTEHPNPHTEHAHFSCEHDLKYVRDTRSWGILEKFGPKKEEDFMEKSQFFDWLDEYYARVHKQGNTDYDTTPVGRAVMDYQDIPWPLHDEDSKGSLWQVLQSIQYSLIVKDRTDEDILEQLTTLVTGLNELRTTILAKASNG